MCGFLYLTLKWLKWNKIEKFRSSVSLATFQVFSSQHKWPVYWREPLWNISIVVESSILVGISVMFYLAEQHTYWISILHSRILTQARNCLEIFRIPIFVNGSINSYLKKKTVSESVNNLFSQNYVKGLSKHYIELWCAVLSCLSHVRLFEIPWTVAHQAPLSMWILQARILEWVAISSSRGSSQPRDRTRISYIGKQVLYH